MKNIFQKVDSFMLFLLVFIIFLKLECRKKRPFKSVKYTDRNDQSYNTIRFISLIIVKILVFMHIFKHFYSSRSHWNVHVIKGWFISSKHIPTKSFQIIFNNIEIGFDTFFSFRHLMLFSYMLIDRVHDFILVTWLLVKFDTKVEK